MGDNVQDGGRKGPLGEGVWPQMIYRSSSAVVVLGRPPPTFLTAVPVVWNAFRARNDTFVDSELCSYTGDARLNNMEADNVIDQRMLDLVKKPNYLQQTVEENGWARKGAIWTLLSDFDLPDFLRLTWKELRYINLGIYQLKQSR
ncbi:DDE Tnp4 domain-containing protein [Trichonephila clavipes]|nr:DDE Tnp4 domain-containing protein [Trichonephila clavipes]